MHLTGICIWGKDSPAVFETSRLCSLQGQASSTYTYIVLPGNESKLMQEAMDRRPWFQAATGDSCNFWWGGNGQKFDWPKLMNGRVWSSGRFM